jgi:hypothetical protein
LIGVPALDTIRIMNRIQSRSALESLDAARAAVVAIRVGDLMGLVTHQPGTPIDADTLARLAAAARQAGIAEGLGAGGPIDPHRLLDALESSPLPEREIERLAAVLGFPRLGELAAVSEPSLRRYAAGERQVPDAVAQRLHFLAVVTAILRGSFNEFGIRRWFDRRRQAIGNRTPARMLRGDWTPDEPDPEAVMDLAVGLLA